jgi:AcrR family transcriptional regulator
VTISRKAAERKARQKMILDGALRVFKSKGLEYATMDEIAQEAEFGKATLYYYYKSKEDIFNTILVNGWVTLWDGIEDLVVTDDTPRKKFIKIIKKIIELVNEDRPLYEFLFAAPHSSSTPQQNEPEWKQYQQKLINTLHQLIIIGIEKGEFPNIDSGMTLKALGHLFHGMVFLGKDRDKITEDEVEELFRQFIEKNYKK